MGCREIGPVSPRIPTPQIDAVAEKNNIWLSQPISPPRIHRSIIYRNAAAIITKTPALPAYIELSDEAAPMKFAGIVEEGVELVLTKVGATVVLDPVPTAVGPAVVLL